MISASGMTEFADQVLNFNTPGLFTALPFHDGDDTDNGLFYKSSEWQFLDTAYIETALRDIAEYTLRSVTTNDTVRFYSLHLKSSTGTANEAARLAEATILRDYLNTLPAESHFIVTGDFNIYESAEPAFQKLVGSEGDNDGRCFDPLNLIGDWGAASFAQYHTQSPRVRGFDGGATGGMDDRFDLMLTSSAMQDNFLTSTFTALGNDGNHYNDSINHQPNTAVPDSIADALHYASDHLPIYARIRFELPNAAPLVVTQAASDVTMTSAQLHGTANPNGNAAEARFAWGSSSTLSDSTPVQSIGSGTSPVIVNDSLSGLTAGSKYYFRIIASNTGGTSVGVIDSFTTLPPVPVAPVLLSPINSALDQPRSLVLRWSKASDGQTYHVQLSTDSLFSVVLIDDSTLTDTLLQTDTLASNTIYYWRVSTSNVSGASGFSAFFTFTTINEVTQQFTFFDGWNMLSAPLTAADLRKTSLFPTAISAAYAFEASTGYTMKDTLRNGIGYWLKFSGDQEVAFTGTPRPVDSIEVSAGWNMIGSLSSPMSVDSIVSVPAGIITSDFFFYDTGYFAADSLLPANAYWVKTSSAGTLIISSQTSASKNPGLRR